MADFSKPDNLSDYATVWDYVKDVQESLSLWQDGTTDTNIPTGAKRYSSTNKRFETFNGTSWVPLIALDTDQANAFQIRVAKANEADSVGVATNALNLGGTAASQFVQTSDARMSDARRCNNTFGSATASREALSVYSKAEMTAKLGLKANVTSPDLTGIPTVPTAAAGTNTVQAASTAFVRNSFRYGPPINLAPFIQSGWTDNGSFAVPIYQRGVIVGAEIDLNATAPSGSTTTRIYSISTGDLATLCSNMGYTFSHLPEGIAYTGNVIIAPGSTMNIDVQQHPLVEGAYGVKAQIKVWAKTTLAGHT